MSMKRYLSCVLVLPGALLALAIAGCGGSHGTQPTETGSGDPSEAVETTDPAEDERAAELAAKEEELALRESEVALKERERELKRREADLLAQENATKRQPTAPKPAQAARPLVVPAGTELAVELTSEFSTKTAQVGQPFEARLASDLVSDGKRVAPAGTAVSGSVMEVVSGSHKVGGTPTLGLAIDGLQMAGGRVVPIAGSFVQQGKKETGKDAAKIAGATVAGAILGHQIDDDKGKLIGAVAGGAAGAAIAQKTGGEVEVPAGTVVSFRLDEPFEVELR